MFDGVTNVLISLNSTGVREQKRPWFRAPFGAPNNTVRRSTEYYRFHPSQRVRGGSAHFCGAGGLIVEPPACPHSLRLNPQHPTRRPTPHRQIIHRVCFCWHGGEHAIAGGAGVVGKRFRSRIHIGDEVAYAVAPYLLVGVVVSPFLIIRGGDAGYGA